MTTSPDPLIECREVTKRFGALVAVKSVDFAVSRGELVALVGDNGAGKSTLIKMICGALRPDGGEIRYDGERVSLQSPMDARLLGIETVYQELALVPVMDITSNLFLGRELVHSWRGLRTGFLRRRAMERESRRRLAELSSEIPDVRGHAADRLSGGQRQIVAIARAMTWSDGLLIMDEPTAALGVRQSEAVLTLARQFVARGGSVVLITHTLPHVMRFADRVVVLRHGQKVGDVARKGVTPEGLIAMMLGAETTDVADEMQRDAPWTPADVPGEKETPVRGNGVTDSTEGKTK